MRGITQDRAALRWGGSFGAVLMVHTALIGAAMWWSARRAPLPLPASAEAVMVELAPLPTAPPAPPTELPPGPPQQEQRQTQSEAEPAPAPQPQVIRREAEVALPQRAQERPAKENAATDVDRTTTPPSVQVPTGSRYAAPQSLSGSVSQTLATWQSQVLGHLERFKRYPRAAQRRRQEGTATVRYTVDRRGNVLAVQLAGSSGHETLDGEALAAVKRASPLPPPPADIPGDPVEVATPINFTIR